MLPSKRTCGAVIEKDGAVREGVPKKPKGEGCVTSSSSAEVATENNHRPPKAMDFSAANGKMQVEIDEDLHSRQLAVYGRETMRRLFASNVLVSGLQGLGVEIGGLDVSGSCFLNKNLNNLASSDLVSGELSFGLRLDCGCYGISVRHVIRYREGLRALSHVVRDTLINDPWTARGKRNEYHRIDTLMNVKVDGPEESELDPSMVYGLRKGFMLEEILWPVGRRFQRSDHLEAGDETLLIVATNLALLKKSETKSFAETKTLLETGTSLEGPNVRLRMLLGTRREPVVCWTRDYEKVEVPAAGTNRGGRGLLDLRYRINLKALRKKKSEATLKEIEGDDIGKIHNACKSLLPLYAALDNRSYFSFTNSTLQAVVFTDISLEKAIEFDDYCHNHQPSIAFIKCEIRGLFGNVFCDFGPKFTVVDVDGEEPHTGIIASISNDCPAFVSCVDDERLEFQDGDLVVFSEVQGMTELNDGKPRKVASARPYSFVLEEDTTGFGAYSRGGIVTQVKQPKVIQFKPLRDALKDPGDFLLSDFSKFDRPALLHVAFQALDSFRQDFGHFPMVGSEEDAEKLIDLAFKINENLGVRKLDDIDRKVLYHFSSGSRSVLNPMAAIFGGIVGQEVMKACSGKFHPLFQFFYFDSLESLPPEPLEPNDLKPLNSRYDAQISVFGARLQNKMEETKAFIVGAGALGCEFLKNLALMGVCCSPKGKLTITDDDVIEKSNLSRQFLFRDWNMGQAKSTVAAAAAAAINPSLHIEALQNRASPETENVFDDSFWESLDVVINALDNVTARMYMDGRCLYFQKPLLESGTLGTKCNTQMVVPHLTENYGASRDPPERQAPMCTVHSFPHNIDHCLTWARSEFEGMLEKTPNEANKFLTAPGEYVGAMKAAGDAQARDLLERVIECLDKDRCDTFEDCVSWARLRFEDYFANRIKQLTFTFPEDAVTSSGSSFWSAPKRFPRPLQFSASDSSHVDFILSASILRAETFGILLPDWANNSKKLVDAMDKVVVTDFEPKKGVKIVTDEKATNLSTASTDDAAVINELVAKLEECAKRLPPGYHLNPIQFEKDDDTNFHMEFIAGLANMRARNYGIPEVDKLKAKFIAGRIIPAIATSTAMATGLVCLELYKVIAGGHKLENYRNTFANLALPLFSMAEPVAPKVIKHQDLSWTVWDRWIIKGNITLRELLQWLKNRGLNAYSISHGTSLLYNSMFLRHKDRLDRKIVELAQDVSKLEVPSYRRHLDVVVACEDDEDNDVDIPLISIYFS
ncbi:ubiquitin-activating enzyme E1 1-like [Phalaenopsis equestris]|uniref:ubiquitin-activating enzyme E1 1-like n=2 Tax=Phalaenopsis equestris TaxID=78828 RepID=UPI0009E3D9A4|nr:ubiquitin-activating enzyme E1 1-like [Phalaenopsis equestris]